MRDVRIAAQPINWINDDFKDLGADTSLEQCLAEMKEAGYAGSELGHRFPDDGDAIRALLARFDLVLASGWHSTYLAGGDLDEERARFDAHAKKLKAAGAGVVILAECTHAIHGNGAAKLSWPSAHLSDDERARVARGLDDLAGRARALGMTTAYHEHMGTVIQDAADVAWLMAHTKELGLLVDTGHLTFAGADPAAVLDEHFARVTHVHLKNLRKPVAERARREAWSFEQAVRAGVFTVPGDAEGCVDFDRVLAILDERGYRGWLVVEAEQDPQQANPLDYAIRARAYLREKAGV